MREAKGTGLDAWVHLAGLCGCNYRVPTRRKGASIYVEHPNRKERTFRISAADFDAGKSQIRDCWCIERYDERAAHRRAEEDNWQA